MKKVGLSLIIIALVLTTSIVLFSCSDITQAISYNDNIEARVGDAYVDSAPQDAPTSAVEYKSQKRITRKFLIDGRIKGSHNLGLYIPIGESFTVKLEASEIGNNHSLWVNENCKGEFPYEYPLNNIETSIVRITGGTLELYVGEKSAETFELTVTGAIAAPLYRYGIDDGLSENANGNYTILDCTSVRIYVPKSLRSQIKEEQKVMKWWKNAVTFMDELLKLSYWAEGDNEDSKYSAMRIYLLDDENITSTIETSANCIYLPLSMVDNVVNYDVLYSDASLKEGKSGIYKILKYIASLKVAKSGVFKDTFLKDSIVDILTQLTYIDMVDAYAADLSTYYPTFTAAGNASKIISKEYASDTEKYCALFTNLYYSLSRQTVLSILDKISQDKLSDSLAIAYIANTYKINLAKIADELKISLYGSDIAQMQTYDAYSVCATNDTIGRVANTMQTGHHVKIGEKAIFDFESEIVADDNYHVEAVYGQEGAWAKLEDGKYEYTPNQNKLKDSFRLKLKSDTNELELVGVITVDIAVCEYSVYNNVSYKTLDEAIKQVKETTPTESYSILTASIPKEKTESSKKKSFAISHGAIQVPKTGQYTLYLKSSGLCSVYFGVEDYSSKIFDNFLTVPEYTDELQYKVKLEEGYKYFYTIYNLSNQGAGYADLGIKYETGSIVPVDEEYLIYSKLKRSDIVEFETTDQFIGALQTQTAEYTPAKSAKIAQFVNIPEYEIGEVSASIEKNAKVSFVLPFEEMSKINYVELAVQDMAGVSLTVYGGVMNKTVLAQTTLSNGKNRILCEERTVDNIKLEFTAQNDYVLHINDLKAGEAISAMAIVPSTSTNIEYIAEWESSKSYIAVNGKLAVSKSDDSELSYSFNGNEISIYATVGQEFGTAKITIDGQDKGLIDLSNSKTICSKLVYNTKLKDGDHTLIISAVDDTPINLDYLAVAQFGETKTQNDFSKLWYIAFIPGLILIAGIVFIVLDIKEKKKRANIKED